jgi:tousled-like kinase
MFCSPTAKPAARFIGEGRYLILALTGKGGYSEVYKAYDFVLNKFVACKMHKFDNQWNEMQKMNYIRYAI